MPVPRRGRSLGYYAPNWFVRKLPVLFPSGSLTVHRTNAIPAGNSRGQAHVSAAPSSAEHANTRRKMSQTPDLSMCRKFASVVSFTDAASGGDAVH